jgi:hypothetical protein
MMPNLGQGGCQAIEDAYVLTEILAQTKTTEKIEDNLQAFYRKRILRVSAVQFLSRLASDLIINAFDTPWSPHDNKGTSWKSYLTFFWKVSLLKFESCFLQKFTSPHPNFFPIAIIAISYFPSSICIPLQLLSKWKYGRSSSRTRGQDHV